MSLLAVVDESGQRAKTQKSSNHFVMSAVVYRDINHARTSELLRQLRNDLGRQPGQRLHWESIKTHDQRLHASQTLGAATYLKIVSVVVAKRLLPAAMPHEHASYLYTLRMLLERLSWIAQDEGTRLTCTLSHVRRFPLPKLRQYEEKLRNLGNETTIRWEHLDPRGAQFNSDREVEQLQLADISASATAEAFEPNRFGAVETRYVRELAPRLYRSRTPGRSLTSYGLKMHPWNRAAQAAYPWVNDL
jgi:hypothetical protein